MSYQQDRITGIPAPLPKDYDRLFDFTGYEALFPNTPKPGDKLDAEFNAIQQALDETQARLRLIQRDDGAITNESIGVEQLKSDVQAGVNPPSDWAEFTQYTVRDTVIVGTGKWYVALESHVSSDDFDADQQAGKWRLLLDLTPYTASFYKYQSFTATAGQDTFAVDYDPNFVRVFKNGLRLFPDQYDSSSGTEVVLTSPCLEDDEVIVEGFTSVVDGEAASNFEVTADGTSDTRTLGAWAAVILQAVSDISDNAAAISDLEALPKVEVLPYLIAEALRVPGEFKDVSGTTGSVIYGAAVSPDGTKLLLVDVSNTIHQFTFGTPGNVKTLTPDGVSLDTSSDGLNNLRGVCYSGGGDYIFVTNSPSAASQVLGAYSLAITNDISSPTFEGAGTFALAFENVRGVRASDDGTEVYAIGTDSGSADAAVVLYTTLTTAYDPTTMSATGFEDVSSEITGTSVRDLDFGRDGASLFVSGDTTPTVAYEYLLNTPGDLSAGAIYQDRSYSIRQSQADSLAFSADGRLLFIAGGGSVTQVRTSRAVGA